MASRFAVKSLDHIVLTVRSIPATVGFYTKQLGMKHEVFTSPSDPAGERNQPITMLSDAAGFGETSRHALRFGGQKINLHQHGREFEPKARAVQPGSGDLCFLTDTRVEEVLGAFKECGTEVLEGGKVVDRTGAVGKLRSVYVRDPDGNLVEVSNYV